jgi:DMSO/TMAO reductase YedYZ molybdopterin-dependent catalytic subunit
MPNWAKVIEGKIRIAKQGAKPSKASGNARIPPGQKQVADFPVLDMGILPEIAPPDWKLCLFGLVEQERTIGLDDLQAMPQVRSVSDFHCVTRWSRLGNLWEGVRTSELLKHVHISPQTRFVLAYGHDWGWTTNMPLEAFLAEDALFADTHDGEPIALEHGGPLRLVVPRLYAWKSAKWVSGVEFLANDQAGYWENGGYHMNGDPWKEERYR